MGTSGERVVRGIMPRRGGEVPRVGRAGHKRSALTTIFSTGIVIIGMIFNRGTGIGDAFWGRAHVSLHLRRVCASCWEGWPRVCFRGRGLYGARLCVVATYFPHETIHSVPGVTAFIVIIPLICISEMISWEVFVIHTCSVTVKIEAYFIASTISLVAFTHRWMVIKAGISFTTSINGVPDVEPTVRSRMFEGT